MDLVEARTLAEAKLREIEDPGTPLVLNDEWGAREIEWAWLFPFDSARYFATREFRHTVPSGPIVVTKDGRDVWVAASAPPVEQWLNQYAAERGYPSVPLPPAFSFGS
jgi:immunity protein 35 of polymorphic toxin system